MKRKILISIFVLVFVAMAAALSSCSQNKTETPSEVPKATEVPESQDEAETPEGEEVQAEPVVLRVGGLEDVDCWNPFGCASTWTFGNIMYEGLVDHGPVPGCSGVPRLAKEWSVSEDGLTWTVELFEGITYTDGTPLTAQTVVDFLNWYISTEMAEWNAETMLLESTEVVDELTFQYTTFDPVLNSPDYGWHWLYIAPPHIWSEVPAEELFTYEVFPPVTSGPYTVGEYEPGQYLIYEARPEYHQGKPPVDQIVYQIYGNLDAIVNALVTGEIDMTINELPPSLVSGLADQEDIFLEVKDPGPHHWINFNLSEVGTGHPALKDVVVRTAIDYAIDKDWIVDVALLGYGQTCANNWACGPNYADQLDPDLEVTPFDLVMANQMLDEAGYADTDDDGVRETADGLPLEFRFFYSSEVPSHIVMAEAITNWLSQIGITLIPEAVEAGAYKELMLWERDFDISLGYGAPDVDAAGMDFMFSCWSAEAGAGNVSSYCSPEFEDLFYWFWFTGDPDEAQEALYLSQEVIYNDRPQLLLAAQNDLQAWRSDKFEIPVNSCDAGGVLANYWALSQIEVK